MFKPIETVSITINPQYARSIFGADSQETLKLSDGLLYGHIEWRMVPADPEQRGIVESDLRERYVGGCFTDLMAGLQRHTEEMLQVVAIVDPGWEESAKRRLAGWMILGYVGDARVQLRHKSSVNEEFDGYLMAIEQALYNRGHAAIKDSRLRYFTEAGALKRKITLLTRPSHMDFRA